MAVGVSTAATTWDGLAVLTDGQENLVERLPLFLASRAQIEARVQLTNICAIGWTTPGPDRCYDGARAPLPFWLSKIFSWRLDGPWRRSGPGIDGLTSSSKNRGRSRKSCGTPYPVFNFAGRSDLGSGAHMAASRLPERGSVKQGTGMVHGRRQVSLAGRNFQYEETWAAAAKPSCVSGAVCRLPNGRPAEKILWNALPCF